MTHLLIQADARRIPLEDRSVHCVVTSPPYFSLRDYGVPGQIGLEATPEAFVAEMVKAFREVWRVLRNDGTVWLNIGDSYNAYNNNRGDSDGLSGVVDKARPRIVGGATSRAKQGNISNTNHAGRAGSLGVEQPDRGTQVLESRLSDAHLRPKNLIGIPWRLALALQSDNWILRSAITWCKTSPMPESVTDRPTSATEMLFLLTKSERYYYDADAVRVKGTGSHPRSNMATFAPGQKINGNPNITDNPNGRNLWNYWVLPTESYAGAHFATFPRRLVEPCILAGTSERGACPKCRAPWERVTEPTAEYQAILDRNKGKNHIHGSGYADCIIDGSRGNVRSTHPVSASRSTLGWRPTCTHDAEPVPCVTFDPFNGSGTTGVVALALNRRYIGCDLSADYLAQARRRVERPHQPVTKQREQAHPLFAHMEDTQL